MIYLLSGSSSGEVIRVLDSNVVYASNSAASGTSHSLPLAYWSGVGWGKCPWDPVLNRCVVAKNGLFGFFLHPPCQKQQQQKHLMYKTLLENHSTCAICYL